MFELIMVYKNYNSWNNDVKFFKEADMSHTTSSQQKEERLTDSKTKASHQNN